MDSNDRSRVNLIAEQIEAMAEEWEQGYPVHFDAERTLEDFQFLLELLAEESRTGRIRRK